MYLVLDTETTGHAPDGGDMIQLGVFNPDGPDFNMHCKPARRILPAAIAVHGITNDAADAFPSVAELDAGFMQYIAQFAGDIFFVGHNIKFDFDVCERTLRKSPINYTIDTLRMAKKLIPHEDIGSYGLDAVFVYLFPDEVDGLMQSRVSHDALEDCKITDRVFNGLINLAISSGKLAKDPSTPDISLFVSEPYVVDVWPFGKHKGKPLDIDIGYARWYMRQSDTDPDIMYSLKRLIR